jgi:hypothetical protein
LDTRDDFSAKRYKEGDNNICYQWVTSDIFTELDDLHDSEQAMSGADFGSGEDETEVDTLMTLGNHGRSKRNEMLAAERTMKHAGSLDDCMDGPPDVGSLEPLEPEFNQPAKAWRAIVLAKNRKSWTKGVSIYQPTVVQNTKPRDSNKTRLKLLTRPT